jgi:hypothetical protein
MSFKCFARTGAFIRRFQMSNTGHDQDQHKAGKRRAAARRRGDRTSVETDGTAFYRAAIQRLQGAKVPFLAGGAYALEVLAGIVRRTKDFDIFVLEEDSQRCLSVLAAAGYRTELTYPHWLGKAFCGEDFIDVIFNSGNGHCRVDEEWFKHAGTGRIFDIQLSLCPVEEIVWQKSFILERDRCDVADVAHLLRHRGNEVNWKRLLVRFGNHWRVLLAQIVLFDFIFPTHRDSVPAWVREQLLANCQNDKLPAGEMDRACYGTLLSASQYLRDVDLEDYRDVRLLPIGSLTPEQLTVWTAHFMEH